jgi:hypothetical protein
VSLTKLRERSPCTRTRKPVADLAESGADGAGNVDALGHDEGVAPGAQKMRRTTP